MLLSAKCEQPTISPHYGLLHGVQMCPTNHPSTQPTMGCHCVPCGSVHSDQTRKAQTVSPNCLSNLLTHFLAVCVVLPAAECSFLMFACHEKQTCRKPWWGCVWAYITCQRRSPSRDSQSGRPGWNTPPPLGPASTDHTPDPTVEGERSFS